MKHPDMPWAYIMERVPTVPEPVGNRMGYAVLGENERAYCEKVLINDYQGGKDMLAKFYDAAGEHLPGFKYMAERGYRHTGLPYWKSITKPLGESNFKNLHRDLPEWAPVKETPQQAAARKKLPAVPGTFVNEREFWAQRHHQFIVASAPPGVHDACRLVIVMYEGKARGISFKIPAGKTICISLDQYKVHGIPVKGNCHGFFIGLTDCPERHAAWKRAFVDAAIKAGTKEVPHVPRELSRIAKVFEAEPDVVIAAWLALGTRAPVPPVYPSAKVVVIVHSYAGGNFYYEFKKKGGYVLRPLREGEQVFTIDDVLEHVRIIAKPGAGVVEAFEKLAQVWRDGSVLFAELPTKVDLTCWELWCNGGGGGGKADTHTRLPCTIPLSREIAER